MKGFKIGDLVYYNTSRNPTLGGLFLGTIVAWAPTPFGKGWTCARVHWFAFDGPSVVELDELELAQNA